MAPHVRQIARRHFLHPLGKRIAILVNFLHRHRAENGAQMAFQRLGGNVADFVRGLAEKLFRRGTNGYIVALDLDLGHAVHLHRHAFAGIDLRRLHIYREQFEREDVHLFENRPNERATALDDAEADLRAILLTVLDAGHDQHLVRPHLGVAAEYHVQEQKHYDDDDDRSDDDDAALHEVQFGKQG